jgi:hypothetical protein
MKARTKLDALTTSKDLLHRKVEEIPLAMAVRTGVKAGVTSPTPAASTHTCDNDAGTCDVDTAARV